MLDIFKIMICSIYCQLFSHIFEVFLLVFLTFLKRGVFDSNSEAFFIEKSDGIQPSKLQS